MSLSVIFLHFKCVYIYLRLNPTTVVRLTLALIFGLGMVSLINGTLSTPEEIPQFKYAIEPRSSFLVLLQLSILSSVIFWHLLLWPVVVSKKLFIYLSPKPVLCIIDYIWYIGGLLTFGIAASMGTADYLKSKSLNLEVEAQYFEAQSNEKLDDKQSNCQIVGSTIARVGYLKFDTEGFRDVVAFCKSHIDADSHSDDILDYCIKGGYREEHILYPVDVDHNLVPQIFGLALEDVASICYYKLKALSVGVSADYLLDSSKFLHENTDEPDIRIYFLPVVFIGLRLVKTTSEFVSTDVKKLNYLQYDFTNEIVHVSKSFLDVDFNGALKEINSYSAVFHVSIIMAIAGIHGYAFSVYTRDSFDFLMFATGACVSANLFIFPALAVAVKNINIVLSMFVALISLALLFVSCFLSYVFVLYLGAIGFLEGDQAEIFVTMTLITLSLYCCYRVIRRAISDIDNEVATQ